MEYFKEINKIIYIKIIYTICFIAYPLGLIYYCDYNKLFLSIIIFVFFNLFLFINLGYIFFLCAPSLFLRVLFASKGGNALTVIMKTEKLFKTEEKFQFLVEGWCVAAYYVTSRSKFAIWAKETGENFLQVGKLEFGEKFMLDRRIVNLLDALKKIEEEGTKNSAIDYSQAIDDLIDFCKQDVKAVEMILLYFHLAEENWNSEYQILEHYWVQLRMAFKQKIEKENGLVLESFFFRTPQTYNFLSRIILL